MERSKIRTTRESNGLSVASAARMVHVSDRTWRRWESGDKDMPEAAWELFIIKLPKNP